MTEEIKHEQPVVPTTPETIAQPTATAPEKTGGERTFTQAELEQIVKERLQREQRKADEAAQKAREKAEADALAKNQEWEKLAKQREAELADATAKLKAHDLIDRKKAVAEKVGLPSALALRLAGETDEEIEADAKALLEALPKPQAPEKQKAPGINPTNPANAAVGETDAQKRLRIFGGGAGVYDAETIRAQGGGAFIVTKE